MLLLLLLLQRREIGLCCGGGGGVGLGRQSPSTRTLYVHIGVGLPIG